MHLLIPFAAAASAGASEALARLELPQLARLLARLAAAPPSDGDESTLSPPHERALAAAWGWQGGDGLLPFAAYAAAADGIEVGDCPWGLLTPVHLLMGREHFMLTDPASLQLGADESRALFDAVRELFESEGFRMAWGAPTRWYAAHEAFEQMPCASLDRVIGRDVDLWLPPLDAPGSRLLRRLQSEVQLLLYPHALTDAREARGAPTVNSVWLSGCGRAQPVDPSTVQMDAALRTPALSGDWDAWAAAWRRLDAERLAPLAERLDDGEPFALTLCGERRWQRFDAQALTAWQRLRRRWQNVDTHALLAAL
jgi:hypothetical protein